MKRLLLLATVALVAFGALAPGQSQAGPRYPRSAPTLLAPAAGSETPAEPTFAWTSVSRATRYRVQVTTFDDTSFAAPVINALADSTQLTPGSALQAARHRWRVRGESAGGSGPWSPVADFSVRSPDPVPPAPSRPSVTWAMAGSALQNMREADETYSRAFFDNASSFVTGPGDGTQYQVPTGWAGVAVANYKSYATFASHVASGAIDSRLTWVKYNPEKWDLTPLAEQQDPYTYMSRFCTLAHTNGYSCMLAPSRDLLLVDGAVCPKQYGENLNQAYLRCGVARSAGTHADHLGIQGQVNQGDPVVYRDFIAQATAQAKSANPGIVVTANLTTVLHDVAQSSCTLYRAYDAVRDVVSGHWLNVTGTTGPVAVNFLRNVEAGACAFSP